MGVGDIHATVQVRDDGRLLFEDVVNLSKKAHRDRLVQDVVSLEAITLSPTMVGQALFDAMEAARTGEPVRVTPSTRATGEQIASAFMAQDPEPQLFVSASDEEAHVAYGSPVTVRRVGDRRLRSTWVMAEYRETGLVPTPAALDAAESLLEAMAWDSGVRHQLGIRTVFHDNAYWYDLGDGRAVRVALEGWAVIERLPRPLFRSFRHQAQQVEPVKGGDLREGLKPIVNLSSDMFMLYLADMVAGLHPDHSRAVGLYFGPHGSGKTTAMRVKRALVDPSIVPVTTMPRDAEAFAHLAARSSNVMLDNLTFCPTWLSDKLSAYCTGDGDVRRRLYSDGDDYITQARGVASVGAINTQPDLLDRSLMFEFSHPGGSRAEEQTLWRNFDRARPAILGALFDVWSSSMRIEADVKPVTMRLLDHARWMEAAAVSLGYHSSTIQLVLKAQASRRDAESFEGDIVGSTILDWMWDRGSDYAAPYKDLLPLLTEFARASGVAVDSKAWPKQPSHLTTRLGNLAPSLRAAGIEYRRVHGGRYVEAHLSLIPSED